MKETGYIENVALAGLLHDIGKFWSRTGQSKPYQPEEAGHFATYSHALWSAHFVERYVGNVQVANWVRMHHRPDSLESHIVSLADWLSSGERDVEESQDRDRPEAAALISILAKVRNKESGFNGNACSLPLSAHGNFDDSAFMPQSGNLKVEQAYVSLWNEFENILEKLNTTAAPINTWQALLRRFCSRIPAATPTRMGAYVPDISLYEHSRTTAALSACMAADKISEERVKAIRTNISHKSGGNGVMSEPICQLVCGNLSGIQDFLYAIPRKGAAKTLKGRSFMLQLLSEACASWLCHQAGVPGCCIIYNGGGRFYLLLPLSVNAPSLASELEEHVHRHFEGAISVLVGAISLAPNDFLEGNFASKWGEAGRSANDKKLRKYTDIAEREYDAVFGTVNPERRIIEWETEAEEPSEEDAYFKELGQALRRAQWLVKTEPGHHPEGMNQLFSCLGFEYHLVSGWKALEGRRILEVDELNGFSPGHIQEALRPPEDAILGYRFTARAWPFNDDGTVKTFEELAESARGAKKLGVFRADVDNLGAIFHDGLEKATISRVAMLSSSLSDFFEGYLDHFVEQDFPDTVGIIYAGGDDLFVVGAWNDVLDFAVAFREKFSRYGGGNPALSFSGGLVIVEDHLPIRYAADLAAEAEEKAKGYERGKQAKNALCLFDTPIGFEEFNDFREFQKLLERMLTEEKEGQKSMPASFLRRLYEVWETYLREHDLIKKRARGISFDRLKAEARWQRWRWMLVYGLRDFAKKNKGWENEVREVQEWLLDENGTIEDRLGVPLRWTELLLKKEDA